MYPSNVPNFGHLDNSEMSLLALANVKESEAVVISIRTLSVIFSRNWTVYKDYYGRRNVTVFCVSLRVGDKSECSKDDQASEGEYREIEDHAAAVDRVADAVPVVHVHVAVVDLQRARVHLLQRAQNLRLHVQHQRRLRRIPVQNLLQQFLRQHLNTATVFA